MPRPPFLSYGVLARLSLLLAILLLPTELAVVASGSALPPFSIGQHGGRRALDSAQPSSESLDVSGQWFSPVRIVVQLPGALFVPFTVQDQRVIIQSFQDIMLKNGSSMEICSYTELYPDPAAPKALRDPSPSVQLCLMQYWPLGSNSTYEHLTASGDSNEVGIISLCMAWAGAFRSYLPGAGRPRLMDLEINTAVQRGGMALRPVLALEAALAVALADTGSGAQLLADQVSVVLDSVMAAVMDGVGTNVEIVNFTRAASAAGAQPSQHLIYLGVTMLVCEEGSAVATPTCEQQALAQALDQLLQSPAALQRWKAAGIVSALVAGIVLRQVPSAPGNATLTSQRWAPWHLDRLDQHYLPLDGAFTANATGTGVNVYLISSGIMAKHLEFGFADGTQGTRVRPAWGYLGLDPLQDCPDARVFYGYGTYAASLCCGINLGAAPNATLHSVRFRENCTSGTDNWQAGTLPSAMDLVLSALVRPAVVLIDTWWTPLRIANSSAAADNQKQIVDRLQKLQDLGITVVASAGASSNTYGTPCDNVIASHPAVLSVGAAGLKDEAVGSGPRNSSCIDLFAPSGGADAGLLGAWSVGPTNYTNIITDAFGAAAVMAGVAAQYLQLHPKANSTDVRRALLGMATQQVVVDAGPASPTALVYTNFTEGPRAQVLLQQQPPAASSGSSGGLSTAAIVGIAVGAGIVALGVAFAGFVVMTRKKRRLGQGSDHSNKLLKGPGVYADLEEVRPEDIEICRRPDGTEWLLGEGRFGKVHLAIKGGVQQVAVKTLSHVNERFKAFFLKDRDMLKFVSRDANITQYFGACMKGDTMMIITEYLEGGDLREAIMRDSKGELLWHNLGKDVMLGVVRGLVFLHASHVVHCDIKSKNILLTRDRRAKLADVGLAQLFDEREAGKGTSFVGTLAWAAPEVLLGEKVTEKADIYSLGVVLWEVVTREAPMRGRMRNPEPRECPEEVVTVIHACMQHSPTQRPTAKELYAMLLACPTVRDGDESMPILSLPSSGSVTQRSLEEESSRVVQAGGAKAGIDGSTELGQMSGQTGEDSTTSQLEVLELKTASAGSSKSQEGSEVLEGSGEVGLSRRLTSNSRMVQIPFSSMQFCRSSATGEPLVLGEGSFSKVYKMLLDGVQPLAAKCVELGSDPVTHQTFLKEAALLWRLRHRHIVGLCGVSIHEGKGYLLMEFMEGGSLYRMLNVTRKSTGQRLLSWYHRGHKVALQVARGIHYLHNLKITHFDCKSANILLDGELNAKVSDVGLARMMSNSHHSLSFNSCTGTLAYMAPELLAGTQCTHAVDIYSFGIVLQEICTGVHPLRGRMWELSVPRDCPQAVADLYMDCTAADPAARPTAREVVVRLLRISEEGAGVALASVQPRQPLQQRQQAQEQPQPQQQQMPDAPTPEAVPPQEEGRSGSSTGPPVAAGGPPVAAGEPPVAAGGPPVAAGGPPAEAAGLPHPRSPCRYSSTAISCDMPPSPFMLPHAGGRHSPTCLGAVACGSPLDTNVNTGPSGAGAPCSSAPAGAGGDPAAEVWDPGQAAHSAALKQARVQGCDIASSPFTAAAISGDPAWASL